MVERIVIGLGLDFAAYRALDLWCKRKAGSPIKRRRTKGEGCLLLLEGCKVWYAQFYQNGKRIRTSTGERDKTKAQEKLRLLMGRADSGLTSLSELKKLTYGILRENLLTDYRLSGNRSLYHRKSDGADMICGLPALDDFFSADTPVTALTTDAAARFVKAQPKQSNATTNRSLALLRRMLHLAHQQGKIQAVPYVKMLPEPPARQGTITAEELQAIMRNLPSHLHPTIAFLWWSGGRKGETSKARWNQVKELDGLSPHILLEGGQTKNKEGRAVPLASIVIAALRNIPEKDRTGRVFDFSALRYDWARACAAAGLGVRTLVTSEAGNKWYQYKGKTIHDCRRSAVGELRKAGVSEEVTMKITGHKTRAVFDRYNIVGVDEVSQAMRKLETHSLQNGSNWVKPSQQLVESTSKA